MRELELEASPRNVLGKKVRRLRREGVTPMNVYGKGMPSVALQASTKTVERVVAAAGHSRLIQLWHSGKRQPVLARKTQRDPRTHNIMHVDLYAVSLTEKIHLSVPLVFVGEATAVADRGAIVLHTLTQVEIEALATDIPQHIEVDISSLREVDDAIHVRDVILPQGVAILSDADEVVAKAAAQRAEEAVEEAGAAPTEAAPATPAGSEAGSA